MLLENVNRESWVNTDVAAAQTWLDNPSGSWKDGLDAAERLANLLEGAQLIAMREPPIRTIDLLRQGQPNPAALRDLLPYLPEAELRQVLAQARGRPRAGPHRRSEEPRWQTRPAPAER